MATEDRGGGIIVSDFDGAMTRHDFYKLAIKSLLPADVPDYWAQYRAGTLTHFEALRSYFAEIRASEADVLAVVQRMELDPELPHAHRDGAFCWMEGTGRISRMRLVHSSTADLRGN